MNDKTSVDRAPVDAVVMRTMTYAELAKLMHDAEEMDDDLTFMEVSDEVFLVRKTPEAIWREFYSQEWKKRMAAKAKR